MFPYLNSQFPRLSENLISNMTVIMSLWLNNGDVPTLQSANTGETKRKRPNRNRLLPRMNNENRLGVPCLKKASQIKSGRA